MRAGRCRDVLCDVRSGVEHNPITNCLNLQCYCEFKTPMPLMFCMACPMRSTWFWEPCPRWTAVRAAMVDQRGSSHSLCVCSSQPSLRAAKKRTAIGSGVVFQARWSVACMLHADDLSLMPVACHAHALISYLGLVWKRLEWELCDGACSM